MTATLTFALAGGYLLSHEGSGLKWLSPNDYEW